MSGLTTAGEDGTNASVMPDTLLRKGSRRLRSAFWRSHPITDLLINSLLIKTIMSFKKTKHNKCVVALFLKIEQWISGSTLVDTICYYTIRSLFEAATVVDIPCLATHTTELCLPFKWTLRKRLRYTAGYPAAYARLVLPVVSPAAPTSIRSFALSTQI